MNKMLVFQTDFTYKEGAVAAMYGVVKSVDMDIEIIFKIAAVGLIVAVLNQLLSRSGREE